MILPPFSIPWVQAPGFVHGRRGRVRFRASIFASVNDPLEMELMELWPQLDTNQTVNRKGGKLKGCPVSSNRCLQQKTLERRND